MYEFEVLHSGDRLWTAHWGPVYFAVFVKNATVESLEQMDTGQTQMIEQFSAATVVTFVPAMPIQALAPGIREKSAEMIRRHADGILGSAVVIGGTGFFNAVVRSLVSGATFVSRARTPTQTFADVQSALRWAVALPGQVEEVRNGYEPLLAAATELIDQAGVTIAL